MTIKNPVNYVAEGCMTFIEALIYQHHVDQLSVYERLRLLLTQQITRLQALDPDRNK